MSDFLDALNEFADYRDTGRPSITEATIAVTEKTARRRLRLKKGDPLVYRGRIGCASAPGARMCAAVSRDAKGKPSSGNSIRRSRRCLRARSSWAR